MEHDVIAKIQFSESLRDKWPSRRFAGLARFESDGSDYPYGQWSLAVELWAPTDADGRAFASVALVAPEAPRHLLQRGLRFQVFVGTTQVAVAVVAKTFVAPRKVVSSVTAVRTASPGPVTQVSEGDGLGHDQDFLRSPSISPRSQHACI
jgi:hypothetical protein